ncbi:MAG: tetratricopeptide repeat protein, partial [Pseudomonadota bacterium]
WTLVAGALTLVVIVSVAAVFALRSSKVWFVGWFWFLGTLVPSIGLLQVHLHGRADRYMYIPLIGLAFLVAFAAPEVLLRILPSGRVSRRCLLGGASAFVLVGCGLSFRQARVWRTSEALYVNALRIDPENYLVLEHLGVLRMRTGDFEQASECFRRAAETVPFKHAPYLMLTARSLAQEGKYSEAYRWHREAIAMAPKNIMARYVFVRTLLQSDRLNEAVEQIEEAAKLPAANADFYQLLGEEMTREGHDSLAIRYFEKSLALEPDRKPVPTLLGSVLARARSQHEAVRFYREYLQEYPNRADVANELAWTLATSVHDDLRDGIEAIAIAEELCQEYEDLSPAVLDTLAAAYAEEGRFDDAVSAAGRALELAKRVGSNEHIRGLEAGVEQYRQKSPHRDRIAEGVLPSGEEQQP